MNTPDLFYQNYSVLSGTVFGEAYRSLQGVTAVNSKNNPNVYIAGNYTFTKSGDDLIVLDESINEGFVIKNFLLNGNKDDSSYEAIGIILEDVEQEEDLITVAGLKYIEVSTQEAYDTLACGNKKQKMKSINNHFHMPWHVETDMREVA